MFSEDGVAQENLLGLSKQKMQQLRGNKIAIIFQEPMTSLNPVHTCGAQVMEALMLHKKLNKNEARKETIGAF